MLIIEDFNIKTFFDKLKIFARIFFIIIKSNYPIASQSI